jgi:predicted aspartyl protease
VTVNGAGPFKFLLDTGSSHTVISATLAKALGASPIAKTVVSSPIGDHLRPVVRLGRVEFGPVVTEAVLSSVVDDAALCRDHRIQGLLGQDVLAQGRYTIDYEVRRVTWRSAPADGGDIKVTLRMTPSSGRYLVEMPQGGASLRLVPDSGAEGLVLFQGPRPIPVAMKPQSARRELSTLTERANVEEISVERLQVGPATWRNLPAVLLSRRELTASDGDGLLPLHLFARVTLDGPGQLLIAEMSRRP